MKPRISLSFYTRPAWSLAASGKLKKTYNYTKITAIILRPHTSPAGIPTQEIYLGSRCTAPYRLEWTFPHINQRGFNSFVRVSSLSAHAFSSLFQKYGMRESYEE